MPRAFINVTDDGFNDIRLPFFGKVQEDIANRNVYSKHKPIIREANLETMRLLSKDKAKSSKDLIDIIKKTISNHPDYLN